ncbi:MAG: AbgT family transporter [Gemmatimonadaceae bacterium]|nr:AbgT family transporter [Gloeobacterales cyanobacterium ES-bin-141]
MSEPPSVPDTSAPESRSGGPIAVVLNTIEQVGNRLPDPLTLFVIFATLVPLLSWLVSMTGWSVLHPATGKVVQVVNLLSPEQIRRMFTGAVENFTAFPPLGTVLVALLGIGVAERSGLVAALLRSLVMAVPAGWVTAVLVFAGINSSLAADAGFVVLPPLGAVLFAGLGRHPIAGLCAAFAGVSGGFSANLLLTSLDPLLAGFTQSAAQLYDPSYQVAPTANYYFMFVSVFLLTFVGWLVTDRIVEPRLGSWDASGFEGGIPQMSVPGPEEGRAVGWAVASFLTVLAGFVLLTVPDGAVLRAADGGFAPFYQSLVPMIAIAFFVPGLVYGILTGSIRDDRTVARMTGETMATMGSYIVLAFAAAQFVAYFGWSNLGLMLAIGGADFLKGIGLAGIPLLLLFILFASLVDLLIASASAKWAVMAPVFVPMLMSLGYSPELVQAAYRVADSFTNVITPLMPYFPIIIAFAQKYDPKLRLGTLIASMLPYSIGFGISWIGLFIFWYLFNLPLGPGAPLLYGPAR